MEYKFINRYNSFCNSLTNLKKSTTANPSDDFVLEGTVQIFNLTFDIAWKVMKDILVKYMGIVDFAAGSPREVLQSAFLNGIIDSDVWLEMLRIRNQLVHDYDGVLAKKYFGKITLEFYPMFVAFRERAQKYFDGPCVKEMTTFYTV